MLTKQISTHMDQSVDFETLASDLLYATYLYRTILAQMEWISFADVLMGMLKKAGENKSIGEFWEFLFDRDYQLEKASLYRYFNQGSSVRLPRDERFLELFRDYLEMSERDYIFLLLTWRLKDCGRLSIYGRKVG